jgi:replicative DNA helicase
MKTGMNPVDDLTSGIQGGLTATVAAWTSHGKSLSLYNSAYVNICEGKNLIYFALEIPKEMVYQIMLARHSYSYGKMIIPYERIVKGQLNDKEEEFVFGELEGDFLKLPGSMIALNMEDIDSFTRQGLISLYRSAEEELGGLDGVYWDHVNLFEYLNFDRNMSGDHYVKLVSDVGKDYRTDKNTLISTLLAAQVNRTGWQRATKKEGQYDMLALSEFHEIERSSTYVIFIFADSFMLQMNEMKVQIVKHRIGRVMESPEIIYVNAECSVVGEDFNTVGSPGGEGFTEALDDILGDNLGGFGDFSL